MKKITIILALLCIMAFTQPITIPPPMDPWLNTTRLDIDLDNFFCVYNKPKQEVYAAWGFAFQVQGQFELKTGRVLTETLEYFINPTGPYHNDMEATCTIKPEWGEDYVDENCMKKLIKNLEAMMPKAYKKLAEKSVYRAKGCNEAGEN